MRKCPACKKWTLDYDDYFGRFRCFDAECGWIQSSSVELERRLLEDKREPRRLAEVHIEELGLVLRAWYDRDTDALSVDFGSCGPNFDLPDADGRLIWRIGRDTHTVVGFAVLGAKRWGVPEIVIDIVSRKEDIELSLKRSPEMSSLGRATRKLVERIANMARGGSEGHGNPDSGAQIACRRLLEQFQVLVAAP